MLPLGFYLIGSKIVQRKRVHRAYKRKLVRDHELEETYFKDGISFEVVQRDFTERHIDGTFEIAYDSFQSLKYFIIFIRILHFSIWNTE